MALPILAIGELINLALKVKGIIETSSTLSDDDKEKFKAIIAKRRDSVSYITEADMNLTEEKRKIDYRDELLELLNSGRMPKQEYVANMGVYKALVKARKSGQDIIGFTKSLDRTLKRYEEK